jgi:hypothetical protein
MIHTAIRRPTTKKPKLKNIELVYDSNNEMAAKTLEYFLSLGFFELQKPAKSPIMAGLDEYRRGEYVVINKGKKQ